MEKTYRILKTIIWVLVFAVVLTGASILYERLSGQVQVDALATAPSQSAEADPMARPAPDFTVYDRDGNAHKLSDYVGKPVILNFWASWCGPCRSEMPEFQRFYETYGDQIHFLLVNLTDGRQETVETASAYVDQDGYTFPVFFDTDVDAAYQYGVNAVPVTYFIDAQGNMKAYAQGALDASRLQKGVDLLLNG